jgi:hypothetical protein
LRLARLAGQPVDDRRHGVAGVIDEQLVTADVGLAHRDGELAFPDPVQLAEAGLAVSLRIARNVVVPEDRQGDVLALELAMDARPVGLDLPPGALPRSRPPRTASPRAWHRSSRRAAANSVRQPGRV